MIATSLLILCAIQAARAQSTVSLFPVGFIDSGLQGEVFGTGADGGTSYRISGTMFGLSIPYTMTLVEDATRVSYTVDLITAGQVIPINQQCRLSSDFALCTEVFATGVQGTTFTESYAAILTGVPISSGPATLPPAAAGTATTNGGATGSIPPIVGPTGSVNSRPQGPDATETAPATPGIPGLTSPGDSGAERSFDCPPVLAFWLAFLVPTFIAFFWVV